MCDMMTEEECDNVMSLWRIWYLCKETIDSGERMNARICGCQSHGGKCKVRYVNQSYEHNCCLNLKQRTIYRWELNTFGTGDVKRACLNYLEVKLPVLWKQAKNQDEIEKAKEEWDQKVARNIELETENEEHKQKCKELQKSCEELTRKLETERQDSMQKIEESRNELDRTSGKLAKLSMEISEVKKNWEELREKKCCHTEKVFDEDESNFPASDECLMEYEYHDFKHHFTELQKKVSELSVKAISSRNSKLICKISGNITSAAGVSSKVNDQVVSVLKAGSTELKDALDDLIPLEAEFPTYSAKSKKENSDEKLLE